jgi:hypothetical protein
MQVFGGFEMARDQNSGHNREHAFATFLHERILADSLSIRHILARNPGATQPKLISENKRDCPSSL